MKFQEVFTDSLNGSIYKSDSKNVAHMTGLKMYLLRIYGKMSTISYHLNLLPDVRFITQHPIKTVKVVLRASLRGWMDSIFRTIIR